MGRKKRVILGIFNNLPRYYVSKGFYPFSTYVESWNPWSARTEKKIILCVVESSPIGDPRSFLFSPLVYLRSSSNMSQRTQTYYELWNLARQRHYSLLFYQYLWSMYRQNRNISTSTFSSRCALPNILILPANDTHLQCRNGLIQFFTFLFVEYGWFT